MNRVLVVQGSANRAGAERVLLTLLRSIDRARFHPSVAFLADGPFVDEVVAAGVDVHRLTPIPRMRHPRQMLDTVAEVAACADVARADIVLGNGEKASAIAGWAARRAHRASVFWLHDAPTWSRPPTTAVQAVAALTPRAAVVTCSQWMATAFRRRFGLTATAIQNGVEPELLALRAPRVADQLPETGWDPSCLVFVHAARLQRWKGTDVFLQAAAVVARRCPNARFLVVGDALYGREVDFARSLPKLAAALGLGRQVHFTGFRSDVLELMAGGDVVVHCSRRAEPFAMVVLEAMATGRALIATRTGGPPEAMGDGGAGLLVRPGDPAALAAAMLDLATERGIRERMGEAGKQRAASRFTADRMAGDFESLFASVLNGAR